MYIEIESKTVERLLIFFFTIGIKLFKPFLVHWLCRLVSMSEWLQAHTIVRWKRNISLSVMLCILSTIRLMILLDVAFELTIITKKVHIWIPDGKQIEINHPTTTAIAAPASPISTVKNQTTHQTTKRKNSKQWLQCRKITKKWS